MRLALAVRADAQRVGVGTGKAVQALGGGLGGRGALTSEAARGGAARLPHRRLGGAHAATPADELQRCPPAGAEPTEPGQGASLGGGRLPADAAPHSRWVHARGGAGDRRASRRPHARAARGGRSRDPLRGAGRGARRPDRRDRQRGSHRLRRRLRRLWPARIGQEPDEVRAAALARRSRRRGPPVRGARRARARAGVLRRDPRDVARARHSFRKAPSRRRRARRSRRSSRRRD